MRRSKSRSESRSNRYKSNYSNRGDRSEGEGRSRYNNNYVLY